MNFRTWIASATHPSTVRRARQTALIVGTVLLVINHGPAMFAGQLTGERILQILLTFLVPYTVSTISSVATRHEIHFATAAVPEREDSLYGTADPT